MSKTYTITQEQMDSLHGAAHSGGLLGGQAAYEGCLKVGAILSEIAFKEGFDKSPGSAPEDIPDDAQGTVDRAAFESAWAKRPWLTEEESDKDRAWRWWQAALAAQPPAAPVETKHLQCERCGEVAIATGTLCDECAELSIPHEGCSAGNEGVAGAAQFLLDRLDEFDPGDDEPEREYHGHVAPAIARLRYALTEAVPQTAREIMLWDALEVASKWIGAADVQGADDFKADMAKIEAALSAAPAVNDEYVLMPREATRAMTMAGCDSLPSCDHVFGHAGGMLANAYRKMVKVGSLSLTRPESK